MTRSELEARITELESMLDACIATRQLLEQKYVKIEQLLFSVPTEVPRRSSGEEYDYIDSRKHLIQEIKAAII